MKPESGQKDGLPIVSMDILREFDRPYVELLNKIANMDISFVSGGYWGFRYLQDKEREILMDYTIELGEGALYVYGIMETGSR
ncbi:MAG: hypothetical protein ACOX8E_07165 [Ruminococcus sp.]